MVKREIVSKILSLILLLMISACGGTTSTGTGRHVDVGNGGDAFAGGATGGALGAGGGGTGGGVAAGGTIGAAGLVGSGGSLLPGCCEKNSDCGDLLYEPCANGVCKNTVPGRCWTNAECPSGDSCIGASVCGCGALCKKGDEPGTCQAPSADAGSAIGIDGSVADGGKDASVAGGDGGQPRADAADGSGPSSIDCATSATCPSESCQITCCPGGGECAPCCVPKSCTSFDAAHCPLDGCQLIANCAGSSICYPFFSAPPPICGGLGYYGGHARCCSGVVLRCGLPRSDGSCDLTVGGYNSFPICIACGDGNCDTRYENRCSCPEDCH